MSKQRVKVKTRKAKSLSFNKKRKTSTRKIKSFNIRLLKSKRQSKSRRSRSISKSKSRSKSKSKSPFEEKKSEQENNSELIDKIKSILPANNLIYNIQNIAKLMDKQELRKQIIKLCGETIGDTAGDFIEDDDSICYFICENNTLKGLFIGFIEDNKLESAYTCSAGKARGELLRYFALLKLNTKNKKIITITGGISGGIPAIKDSDSPNTSKTKHDRLLKYHRNRGAMVKGDIFTYSLDTVKMNVAKK